MPNSHILLDRGKPGKVGGLSEIKGGLYQHMKSTLPSMPTRAHVLMFPIMP